jgi:hypothetical protein
MNDGRAHLFRPTMAEDTEGGGSGLAQGEGKRWGGVCVVQTRRWWRKLD